ncbi:hypothetical protein M011DRAFT_477625 [Sporormia fimetaria CBS 119925]|uniref:Uncharacterized protein n=1 Tax=Sporormia fimetaria CBS 119925 TaxID=1340428 RepID=A0A6A6VC79_9PLEO|nr:hypothetical protein M011DRAFT_477625 [Sporormia fimetaria CBS 119925]
MKFQHFVYLVLAPFAVAQEQHLEPRQACVPCRPELSITDKLPPVGEELDLLYQNALGSVQWADIHFKKRAENQVEERGQVPTVFCCQFDCLNLMYYNVAMCYDKYTTQFSFPDGSWGSLTTGEFVDNDGAYLRMFEGSYMDKDGKRGNVYDKNPEASPNLAILSIPPQWTGSSLPPGREAPPTDIASLATTETTTSEYHPTDPAIFPGFPEATTEEEAAKNNKAAGEAAGMDIWSTEGIFAVLSGIVYAFV